MAKQLETITVRSPGFLGVNTQDPWSLDPQYALAADNCVIDSQGRLGSRKGWRYLTSINPQDLLGLARFQDINGAVEHISWDGQGSFYKGINELEEISLFPVHTIPNGDWKAVTLNDHIYFYARNEEPLVYSTDTSHAVAEDPNAAQGFVFQRLSDHRSQHGHTNSFFPLGKVALSAYGRVFVADTQDNSTVVYFSSLLDGSDFGQAGFDPNADDISGAVSTAGALNVSALFTKGTDRITGLAAINGVLAIFCRDSIIIFGDNDPNNDALTVDPVNFQLIEIIEGVGCISQKTIQNVGDDILFLADSGVKSLGRTIQEKSQPFNDISINVKSEIIDDIVVEKVSNFDNIRSVYSDSETFYLVSFPATQKVYCFDTKQKLDNGAYRVTKWFNVATKDYLNDPDLGVLLAQTEGYALYDGANDGFDTDNNPVPIPIKYVSPFLDLGNPTALKILKKLSVVVVGASGQTLSMAASFDFQSPKANQIYPFTIQLGQVSRFGIDRYGEGKYNAGIQAQAPVVSASGTGNLIQFTFTASVTDAQLSLQKVDIFLKQGKTL